MTADIYTTVPKTVRPFLFTPEISGSSSITFSSKFETEAELMASIKNQGSKLDNQKLNELNEKLQSLRSLSSRFLNK